LRNILNSRREFLRCSAFSAGAALWGSYGVPGSALFPAVDAPADYTVHIKAAPIEIAPKRFISTVTYNGQFPPPLLRFKQGQPATVEIFNHTDTPEQLHWHGLHVSADVDGAAEERTPFIPAHGMRRVSFVPEPSGLRFYHTHNRAGADLGGGQYSGQVGAVYVEPKDDAGRYEREIFLTLKEFEPRFGRGGDMAQDFLSPRGVVKSLQETGETAMKTSLAKGIPHGFEVGYAAFTINGRMLGHGEPIRVKTGERVLFHVLNGSATEIRSLALPGHEFEVAALDGNAVENPTKVPVLWLGTAERISAIVEMKHPGVWILGDLADDDRRHGMGIVVEYAGHAGKPVWIAPPAFRWDYTRFALPHISAPEPEETIEMTFAKDNAAEEGFNRWTINGTAFPMSGGVQPAQFHLRQGRLYRIRMRNASDDIHPIHLHRHSFQLTRVGGKLTAGVWKDGVMLGGYQEMEIQFVADNPGLTLFHCHQQLHMDFGFMALFDYL